MKMREEIDALSTMRLIRSRSDAARILALVCALPILSFFGSMAALYGGGLVAWLYGGMGPEIFLARLREAISVTHFEVGIIKAPFMALVIGVVACSEGLRVKGSAKSWAGRPPCRRKSIFLVIVLEGCFRFLRVDRNVTDGGSEATFAIRVRDLVVGFRNHSCSITFR